MLVARTGVDSGRLQRRRADRANNHAWRHALHENSRLGCLAHTQGMRFPTHLVRFFEILISLLVREYGVYCKYVQCRYM